MPDEILKIRFGYKQEKLTMELKKEKEVQLRLFQEDSWLFQGGLYSICSSQRSTGSRPGHSRGWVPEFATWQISPQTFSESS